MAYRFSLKLPAYVELAGQKFSARLVNLARCGALIETSRIFAEGTAMVFHCGNVRADAVAAWGKGSRSGITFLSPLAAPQVQEQLSRSLALVSMTGKAAE